METWKTSLQRGMVSGAPASVLSTMALAALGKGETLIAQGLIGGAELVVSKLITAGSAGCSVRWRYWRLGGACATG